MLQTRYLSKQHSEFVVGSDEQFMELCINVEPYICCLFTNSLRLAFLIIIDLMPHLAGAIAGLKACPCPFIQISSRNYPDEIGIKFVQS